MKNKLKLLLLSMMFIGLGLSFCSAETLSCGSNSNCKLLTGHVENLTNTTNISYKYFMHFPTSSIPYYNSNYSTYGNYSFTYSCQLENVVGLNCGNVQLTSSYVYNNGSITSNYVSFNSDCYRSYTQSSSTLPFVFDVSFRYNTSYSAGYSFDWSCTIVVNDSNFVFPDESSSSSCPESEPSSINVLYNNENSTTNITCNGDNIIQIDGLSTITATNKFTPYFNIDYRDENNQSLIESYSKNILYLTGGLLKKTFTGDNDWILTIQGDNNDNSFSGYVPTFDVVFTGDTFNDTGNVFNNFAQNSLQVALSNIPSYIQYVIIIMLLFFILGLARRKKRR